MRRVIIVLANTENLETLLKNINQKAEIIFLLELLLNIKIKDYDFISIQKFNSITEYDFSLATANVVLRNGGNKKIYAKLIKGGMIKESIFCYWSLLYEEFSNRNKKKLPQKVSITEKKIQKNKKNIILTLDHNLNYCTEIYLVEIKQFLEENIEKNKNLKNLKKYFSNNDILFLGII